MVRLSSPLAETPNAKDYIDIMVEIRKLALYNDFEEKTPTIVVFGDQSSGKSSVLARLTGGLPMPRGSTKCTATPFEIRMLQTDEQSRRISLRYVEDKNRKPTQSREVDFANISEMDEEEIEEKLREAQRFVQNPSIVDVGESTNLPHDDDELAFTKNAVCVTISGPDQMYSLSMVDLPGVVRNNEDHETFVLSLVKEYIRKDSAILVPIFQATSDIATQCAWRLAREADPTGQRTVGVLTKIDRIIDYPNDDEKHLELATLVRGIGEHQISNGTYIVRNPSGGRSDEDPDELEQATIRALKKHRIWRDVPADRFGLNNLTMKLSELQRKAHEMTWPRIRPYLEDCRAELERKLNALPQKPEGNPNVRFMELVGIFDKQFTSHANAEDVEHRLYRGQQWNFGQFDQALLSTRPIYKLSFDGETISNEIFDPIKPGALQYRGWAEILRAEISADPWGESEPYLNNQDYVWTLDELSTVVQKSQGGQVAGYFPYKAVVSIVNKHQKDWFTISTQLLDKNYDWVVQFTDELVEKTFKEFPNAVDEIKRVLRVLLRQCKDETYKRLRELDEMEKMSPSRALYVTDEASILKKQSKYFVKLRILTATSKETGHVLKSIVELGSKLFDLMHDPDVEDDEFEKTKADLIDIIQISETNDASQRLVEEIRSARRVADMPSTATLSMMMIIKNQYLDKLIAGAPRSNEDDVNQSLLRNTNNEHAFLAATGALAYWKMVHSKFREVVPRVVEYYLVNQFAIRLGMYLRTHFKLLGTDAETKHHEGIQPGNINLKDLLGEDPECAKNRKEWKHNIDALSNIIDRVRRASVKYHFNNRK